MVYVLRTGIQWNALPRELGASSTVHDRFQEWERAGVFKALWQAGLQEYDELIGIQWEWQAVDGVMTKAPDLWRRDRSQSHRSRQAGSQAQSSDGWGGDSLGSGH
jgi:transposase